MFYLFHRHSEGLFSVYNVPSNLIKLGKGKEAAFLTLKLVEIIEGLLISEEWDGGGYTEREQIEIHK